MTCADMLLAATSQQPQGSCGCEASILLLFPADVPPLPTAAAAYVAASAGQCA
jgi:hypothetical protein